MCTFFSLLSDGRGNLYYMDADARKNCGNLEPDSHTSICEWFKKRGVLANGPTTEDKLNKYEYNPLTREFAVDLLNTNDDSEAVRAQCLKLDFSMIVPELIIKPIIHPFLDKHRKCVTKKDIAKLRKWASVGDSVLDSVRASVLDSVLDSVRASVYCYVSSFFDLREKNPFQCSIDLWERGLVASFDGKAWRLHGGKNGSVMYEEKK